jgi:hypothetical protein
MFFLRLSLKNLNFLERNLKRIQPQELNNQVCNLFKNLLKK